MNAAGRLGLYAAGVLVAFAGAFGVAAAVAPDRVGDPWNEEETEMDHSANHAEPEARSAETSALPGLALSAGGYLLSPIVAPAKTGEDGVLSFRILAQGGDPLTEYAQAHDKELHLIVVRSDGAEFRHVHPALDEASGTWSLPWKWESAGTYRVYADFTPGGADAHGVTLTRTVDVAGDYSPVPSAPTRVATVGGYTATISGDLVTGSMNELTISIHQGAEPVTRLEPYLGAFGHLVALREGDLAYLHVHPDADDPLPDERSGPDIAFMAEPPTPGRYLLYLDFQVDGEVHTAAFVLDATGGDDGAGVAPEDDVHEDDEDGHGH